MSTAPLHVRTSAQLAGSRVSAEQRPSIATKVPCVPASTTRACCVRVPERVHASKPSALSLIIRKTCCRRKNWLELAVRQAGSEAARHAAERAQSVGGDNAGSSIIKVRWAWARRPSVLQENGQQIIQMQSREHHCVLWGCTHELKVGSDSYYVAESRSL